VNQQSSASSPPTSDAEPLHNREALVNCGTSLSSPIFAGLMALVDQAAGHPHGFANPLFYQNPSAFYDVLSINSAVARRNYVNNVDASAGTADLLRTFDDYSGSPTQHTGSG
jgi:subtilase family serine protease